VLTLAIATKLRVPFRAEERDVSLLIANFLILKPLGTGGGSPKVKQQSFEADHSPSSSSEVTNGGAIPPLHNFLRVLMLNYADGSFDLYFHAILI
jgi:hypothetical protein